VARAIERGIVEQISRSHVQRILQAGDVRPHRVQQWLHSPDPAFREKVNVICKLYRKVPKNAVVLSIDEKTGIQAIERKHPGRAPAPGRLRRREFEYIRHGTQALIAALDVHTGQVLADCRERRTQDDLVSFMERVAVAHPGKRVHVIWDNLNTHRAQAVWQAFNEQRDERFHFHLTPLHASWVNQIELWFARYTRRVLRLPAMPAIRAPRTCASVPSSLSASIIRQHAPSNGLSGAIRCKLAHRNRETDMPAIPTKHYAAELQRKLRSLLGHEQIVTQAYGRHLLIKRLDDEESTVVARLTELARNRYSAAFRSHTGRWEPLPGTGSLDEMADVVVTLLQPYLQPDNY